MSGTLAAKPAVVEDAVFVGGSVKDAVRAGLQELGLEEGDAQVTVLQKGSRGFFGLGSRAAKVQVLPKARWDLLVGELARGILSRMEIEARVIAHQVGSTVHVQINAVAADGLLIGRKGETLEAFQHVLLRMAGRRLGGKLSGVRVEVGDYRSRRELRLKAHARDLAERVARTGRRVMTEPLSPGERRLVHRALADNDRVRTHAGGGGVNKRVIITPGRREGDDG
jgi:spoIIIJ-associated protein